VTLYSFVINLIIIGLFLLTVFLDFLQSTPLIFSPHGKTLVLFGYGKVTGAARPIKLSINNINLIYL